MAGGADGGTPSPRVGRGVRGWFGKTGLNHPVTITAAADGSALGNPGPAGWAWYIDDDQWAAGGWAHGTNNMGELTAVLDLLQQTAKVEEDLVVLCDSTYAINSITKWMPGWKRKGWKKGDGKPVQNLEIMKALDAAMSGRRVRFEWVKGHAGHPLNEAADARANAAARAFQAGRPPATGPGFPGGGRAETVVGPSSPAADDLFALLDDSEVTSAQTDEEIVVALERSLLTDEVRADRGAVAALLHPQWREIGSSGTVWERADLLDRIAPLERPVVLEVIEVGRWTPDLIQLVWRSASSEGSQLRSSLWVRTGRTWQQRFHQGTPQA